MKYGFQGVSRPVMITQAFAYRGVSGLDLMYGSNITFRIDHMFNNEQPPASGD